MENCTAIVSTWTLVCTCERSSYMPLQVYEEVVALHTATSIHIRACVVENTTISCSRYFPRVRACIGSTSCMESRMRAAFHGRWLCHRVGQGTVPCK